jgi:SAM-dependent methyltransferase
MATQRVATAAPRGFLATPPRVALQDFLARCAALGGIDVARVGRLAQTGIAYLTSSAARRLQLRYDRTLELRWYASLAAGQPDWGVYAADDYLAELWSCWAVYSRRYLGAIRVPTSLGTQSIVAHLGTVRAVADLGCGIGYSTAALTELFPQARVTGTNLDGIAQTQLARGLGADYGFTVVAEPAAIPGPVDLVFASEYFEHIPAPVDHLRTVLDALMPRALLVANTFGPDSVGHFHAYTVDGQLRDPKVTAQRFQALLRQRGYRRLQTRLWNNRPTYWVRIAAGACMTP